MIQYIAHVSVSKKLIDVLLPQNVTILEMSIEQLESYLGRLGLDFGWLFVFDRRKNALPMEERLSTQVVLTQNQRAITVIRA